MGRGSIPAQAGLHGNLTDFGILTMSCELHCPI